MKINAAALALLAASAAAVPLSSINATGTPFTNATATATGPDYSIEPCVMPDGCRWEHKRPGPFDPPRKTVSHASSTTAEPTSRSTPAWGDLISSILNPGTSEPPYTMTLWQESSSTETAYVFGTPPPKITETLILDPMPTVPPMA